MATPPLASGALGATVYVTPTGGPGYDAQGQRIAETTRRLDDATLTTLRPGDILQLLADTPTGTARFAGPVKMTSKGAAGTPSIVIRGLGDRTVIAGSSIDEVRGCPMPADDRVHPCNLRAWLLASLSPAGKPDKADILEQLTEDAPAVPPLGMVTLSVRFEAPKGPLVKAVCLDLDRVDGVTIEDLRFEGCWLSAVRAIGSRRVTLQRATILGGSYGLAARGKPSRPAELLTVQDVTWIQDVSGYARLTAQGRHACKLSDGSEREVPLGCPGEMWRTLPWGATHHGVAEHYNGVLLGGVDVAGKVVFRRNRVFSAYNGIRLKANACEETSAAELSARNCAYNDDVWIGDNIFSYVRDNPVEMEVFSRNVRIVRNQFHNSHAWLSFDDMGGGPIYAYANRGWFDDMPAIAWTTPSLGGNACLHDPKPKPSAGGSFDPRLDRRFDYKNGAWLPVAQMGEEKKDGVTVIEWMAEGEQTCEASLVGRTLKFALPEKPRKPGEKAARVRSPTEPIYVFNNSWFLRAPVAGTGATVKLRHWNNAILFCEAGVEGYDATLCQPRPAAFDPACGLSLVGGDGLARYLGSLGKLPFFDCFRWLPVDENGKERADLESEFDHDVSSNGFPVDLRAKPKFEPNGRAGDPGFAAPSKGDFLLKIGALASRSACRVTIQGGELRCSAPGDGDIAFAGALAPSGDLYAGPSDPRFAEPP